MEDMSREIIIPRKKSTSLKNSIIMFLAAALFILFAFDYFYDFLWLESKTPVILVVFAFLVVPIFIFGGLHYLRQVFDNNPVLTVNELGINEQISRIRAGLIMWNDIEHIKFVPYMDKTYWICITLKEPEKYINNPKLLEKMKNGKGSEKWGHIAFDSMYFKKEWGEVSSLIRYYHERTIEINEDDMSENNG